MKYQGHEVEIMNDIGKNVIIRRVDGGKFWAISELRHHYNARVETDQLSVSKSLIEYRECTCRPETSYGISGEACDYCKSLDSAEIPF